MPKHIYFPTHIGLLTKEHRDRIGPALWEFLWCIAKTTKELEEQGENVGLVLGGKPVSYMEIANDLGGSKSTIKRNFERLEKEQYISLKRTPYGQIIKVKNSKKFYQNKKNRAKYGTGAENGTGVPKMTQPCQIWHTRAENDHSNKDKEIDKKINKKNNTTTATNNAHAREEILGEEGDSAGVPTTDPLRGDRASEEDAREIAQTPEAQSKVLLEKFVELKGSGLFWSPRDEQAAEEILSYGVPLDKAIKWLELRFKTYKPKHPRNKINSLDYCVGFIMDKYHEEMEKEQKAGDSNGKRLQNDSGRSQGFGKASKSYAEAARELADARSAWE
mgnify:CR=1 FL=1